MDNKRSIKTLSTNESGEENSAKSYRTFMLAQLRKNGGVMTRDELEAALLRNYGHTFGPDDVRRVGKRLKWQNTLDWAKAVCASKGEVATRSRVRNKVKTTYIVLLDPSITSDEWIEWASAKRKKKGFLKKCPKCKQKVPLGWESCWSVVEGRYCGLVFPEQSVRVDRIPK